MVRLSLDERKAVARWAADATWMEQEKYLEDTEYMECVRDLMEHPVVQSMENYIQHGSTTCLAHCIQVSYLSYRICRKFGWNSREAARAGILHDMFLYDWHTHGRETGERFHGFTHPRTALRNAEKYFSLSPEEANIILRHMWPLTPVPPGTGAGFAVVYADKLCSLTETVLQVRSWFAWNFLLRRA